MGFHPYGHDFFNLGQINFTAPLDAVPLPRDFKIPEGATVTFSTTATGKPVARISGLPQGDFLSQWASESKEHPQVAISNSKAFNVVLTNGSKKIIEAQEVSEENGRVRFLGVVEGHEGGYDRTSSVIASFASDAVVEYSLIPISEDPRTGANTYRITFVSDSAAPQDVVADRLLFTSGDVHGHYSLVTTHRNGSGQRTEFLVGSEKVFSIHRIVASGQLQKVETPETGIDLVDVV